MAEDRRKPPESLVLMAARFRTERQLRRLSRLPTASGDRVSFAVLGDAEPSRFWIYRKLFNREGVFHDQMVDLQSQALTFTVQLGDMVPKGTLAHYENFFRGLRRVWSGRPYLTVCGNHDRSRPNGKSHSTLYRSLFGRSNYLFDHGGVRFVVLDSSAKRVTKAQLKWLRMALDVPGRKIVFTHMPPVQLSLWGGVGKVHELGGFIGGAREFAEIVSAAKVSRVYMGHVHAFGVQDHGGVRYVLTGGGGSALFPSGNDDRFHHYLTVEITATSVKERVHMLDGKVFHIPQGLVLLPTHDEKKRRWWELV
ncbi:MAG: metallophosphoesterase family protein [Elusimicrobiota bacterium]|nr:MAG: metallophosphoesterase family protein [Elusimicrobiota bacterium]